MENAKAPRPRHGHLRKFDVGFQLRECLTTYLGCSPFESTSAKRRMGVDDELKDKKMNEGKYLFSSWA